MVLTREYAKILLAMSAVVTCMSLSVSAKEAKKSPSGQDDNSLTEQEKKGLEDTKPETIVIEAPRLSSGDESTSMAQTLKVADSTSRLQTVTEVVQDAVGVQVRTLGGLGAYGSASIRGSTPNQVPVYLDGVLLNAGGFDTVNLGDLSLDLFQEINIYRSGAPSSLGTSGIGGAIQFKTRQDEQRQWQAAITTGSYNTYRLMLMGSWAVDFLNSKILSLVSASESDGDFLYFDDNGTEFNSDDDTTRPRQNNGFRSITGLMKIDSDAWAWHWTLLDNVLFKKQGIAGMDLMKTQFASLDTRRNALSLQGSLTDRDGWRLKPEFSYLYLHEDMDDSFGPHGELGMGRQHTSTTTHALAGGLLFQWEPTKEHFSTIRTDLRWERLAQRDLLKDSDEGRRDRIRAALAAQHQWTITERLSLLPSGRFELIQSKFDAIQTPGTTGVSTNTDKTDLLWQAAMGARWDLLSGLTMKINAGRYNRPPSLGELFGYRGTVIGNPDLRAETGFKTDLGLELTLGKFGPLEHLTLEVAGFATWSQDLIAFWQNSQHTVKAQNIDSARVLGAEINTSVIMGNYIKIWSNYTFMDTRNLSDTPFYNMRRLPGRPAHELYAKVEIFRDTPGWSASVWTDVSYSSGNFLDPSNLKDAGARTLVGAGMKIASPRHGLSLTVQVKNIMDTTTVINQEGYKQALEDYEGFPLPGRTVLVTLCWKSPLESKSS